MYSKFVFLVCFTVCASLLVHVSASGLQAGVAKVDGTLPIGAPLAGYNHGPRRAPYWPWPHITNYTTFMMPSVGALNPTWCKALVIQEGGEKYAFATIDGIGADGTLIRLAYDIATGMGLQVPWENLLFSASHSHSGPAGVSPEFLWGMAPATDLMVPELQRDLATNIARALVYAQGNMTDAVLDTGTTYLTNVTQNRRASISPYVTPTTIDPHLGVMRVDDASTGEPMATVWNFAIHGICFGPNNMNFSSDIMGAASQYVENELGGVALFINGDAGDIDPGPNMCNMYGDNNFTGSPIMGQAVIDLRNSLNPTSNVSISSSAVQVEFGWTNLNYTLARFNNCTSGGELDICSICEVLHCDLNAHLPSSWIEDAPFFTAFRFDIDDTSTVMVSIPGEALVELGWQIRNDTADMGFDITFLAGYSQSHMGYFATPNEYDIGGYESQLTLWGINTSNMVRAGCKEAALPLAPNNVTMSLY